MNYRGLYEEGFRTLTDAGIADARTDSGLLLEYICNTNRNFLYAHGDSEMGEEDSVRYFDLIKKRSERIPLQQLTGSTEFMGLAFRVNEHVLCPRLDTECLVEEAMIVTNDGDSVLDLCTGSGCILISIMKYKNDIQGVGADLSEDALNVARINAEQNDVRAVFVHSDLYENVDSKNRFDVIVSNPPYIRPDVIETLDPEVKDHEPRMALDGGEDGLDFYRRIIDGSPAYIKKGGYLLFEIGYDQGRDVANLMERAGYIGVKVVQDLAGLDRVVLGQCSNCKE